MQTKPAVYRRRPRGAGLFDTLHGLAKSTGLLGSLAGAIHPSAGNFVKSLGYGHRKPRKPRAPKKPRALRGGGILGGLLSAIGLGAKRRAPRARKGVGAGGFLNIGGRHRRGMGSYQSSSVGDHSRLIM